MELFRSRSRAPPISYPFRTCNSNVHHRRLLRTNNNSNPLVPAVVTTSETSSTRHPRLPQRSSGLRVAARTQACGVGTRLDEARGRGERGLPDGRDVARREAAVDFEVRALE